MFDELIERDVSGVRKLLPLEVVMYAVVLAVVLGAVFLLVQAGTVEPAVRPAPARSAVTVPTEYGGPAAGTPVPK